MVNKSYRVVSGLLATIIVLSLFLTGPTQALKLDFFIPNNYISTENPASFIATTTIETGEILDITSFTIRLIGKNIIECHFNPDGSLIGSCPILNIVQIENSEYSFGYGYLPGNLKYEITINPNTLPSGQYSTNLIANIDGNSFSSSSSEFTLIETLAESNKCSLRAKKGEAIHEGITFERKNKLSLYSPTNKASNGQGSFSTQKGRNRITYSFDIMSISKANSDLIIFNVEGDLRKNTAAKDPVSARVILNTVTFEASLISDDLNIEDMEVIFADC